MAQISLAPLAPPTGGQPPTIHKWRLVYPSVRDRYNGSFQVVEIADVAVEVQRSYKYVAGSHSANDDSQTVYVTDGAYRGGIVWQVDQSWYSRHVLWPDLLWPEGAETDPAHRYHHVLNWVEVDENLVDYLGGLLGQRIRSQAWYPEYVDDAWTDPQVLRDTWIYAVALPPPLYPWTTNESHFFGDYKYGTFMGEDESGARYFVPWNETVVDSIPSTYGVPNAQLIAKMVRV